MAKFTKSLTRVVTISTYAIIFCIIGNIVMPDLIVENVHAQSVTSSTTTQLKLSASDKELINKAKSDVKATLYKQFGLSKSEITFSDNFDMDSINKKVDKYVSYDQNGNASLNANAYRKDGTVKLSKSNTEIVISIANKMITSYNKAVKSIISTNTKSSNMVEIPNLVVTKTIIARGVNVTYDVIQNNVSSGVSAASRSVPSVYRTQITNWGWNWGFDLFVTNEYINSILDKMTWAGFTAAVGAIATKGKALGLCFTPFSGIICGLGAVAIAVNIYLLRDANNACGQRGAYYIYRPYSWWGDYTRIERVC